MKLKICAVIFLSVFCLNLLTTPTLAQNEWQADLQEAGKPLGHETKIDATTFPKQIGNVVKIILSILGLILLGLIVYAGILWMTSAGDEEKIKQAKNIMINAVVGLAIVVLAYALTWFIMDRLGNITKTT